MSDAFEWEKPVLIILDRGTSDEDILRKCKNDGGSAAIFQHMGCYTGDCHKYCEMYGVS